MFLKSKNSTLLFNYLKLLEAKENEKNLHTIVQRMQAGLFYEVNLPR